MFSMNSSIGLSLQLHLQVYDSKWFRKPQMEICDHHRLLRSKNYPSYSISSSKQKKFSPYRLRKKRKAVPCFKNTVRRNKSKGFISKALMGRKSKSESSSSVNLNSSLT